MKTVYKICAAIAAIFIFGLCLVPFNRTAKATDYNNPNISEEYIFTKIAVPINMRWTIAGTGQQNGYQYPVFTFIIYNTTKLQIDGTMVNDMVEVMSSNGGVTTVMLVMSRPQEFSSIYGIVLYPQGINVPNIKTYDNPTITIKKEYSDNIEGYIRSYTIKPEKIGDNALTSADGISVQFNFDTGYKRYYFYSNLMQLNSPSKEATTYIQVSSADTIGSFNQGKQEGYQNGYQVGYEAGKSDGEHAGYNKGYTTGYNQGRDAPEYSFKEFFIGLGDSFVTIYTSMLNYEFLGINIAGLIGTVVVIITILIVTKIILRK